MKSLIFIFISIVFTNIIFSQGWGEWKAVNQYPNLQFRVKYDYYNIPASKEGKPADVWRVQIRNNYTKKVGISWGISDYGKSSDEVTDWRRNSCIQVGETIESSIHFTNTPKGGTVIVWFKKFEYCNY